MEVILAAVCLPAVGLLQIAAWFSIAFIVAWVVMHTEKLIEPSYRTPGNVYLLIALSVLLKV